MHRIFFDSQVLAVTFVAYDTFGTLFELLFERCDDRVTLFGFLAGLARIYTDNIAMAVACIFALVKA